VINRLMNLMPQRMLFVIFEFTPQRFAGRDDAADYLRRLAKDFLLFDIYYCPNPTRFDSISEKAVDDFVAEVVNRAHGYTDVFLLDRRAPDCNTLVSRLASLRREPDALVL
jgi:hypothetical protein